MNSDISNEAPAYSFSIDEKSKFRKMIDSVRPGEPQHRYTCEWVKHFDHVRPQLTVDFIQMGCGNVLEIENKSTWPMFIRVFRDGQLITRETPNAPPIPISEAE